MTPSATLADLPTPHIFAGDLSTHLTDLARFMDNGLSSDDENDSGNEDGAK